MKHFRSFARMLYERGEMLPVGVGEENLPETIAAHELQYAFNALTIKSVKNIVKQQDWFAEHQSLRKLHSYQICLCCP